MSGYSFKLNRKRPREKVIADYLDQFTDDRMKSMKIKEALYEKATGIVQTTAKLEVSEEVIESHKAVAVADLLAGIDDWGA